MLEIACFSDESVQIAAQAGAQRIELGEDYSCGGTTPSLQRLLSAKSTTSLPIHVLIRNRAGHFLYEKDDLETMASSIKTLATNGADGFVFGALNSSNMPDEYACQLLLEQAQGKPCIFHRAFDEISEQEKALELLQKWGFSGLLTSGGLGSAWENRHQLARLKKNATQNFQLMPGGSIRSAHLAELHALVNATAYHSAAIFPGSALPNPTEIQQLLACLSASF
jgi:copper homeostasis protein